MPDYFVNDFEEENWRLEVNSRVLISHLGDKISLASVDLTRNNLRILDSATSNGRHQANYLYEIEPNETTRLPAHSTAISA